MFGQTIPGAGRGPVLFRVRDRGRSRPRRRIAAELVVARFVGKQGLVARSDPFDPLPENFASLDRARRCGRDLGIRDILRSEFAEMIVLNPRLGPVDHHAVGVFIRARIEL